MGNLIRNEGFHGNHQKMEVAGKILELGDFPFLCFLARGYSNG